MIVEQPAALCKLSYPQYCHCTNALTSEHFGLLLAIRALQQQHRANGLQNCESSPPLLIKWGACWRGR
jgi:hypothetical protein